jgi:hypothetical protein
VNKLRWGKFYWSDWADDPALALCSLAAQGLWMRLLCIAAQGTPYGHVTVNGKPPSMDDLAKLIRPKPKPATVARLIAELQRRGVVERDACGCLVSRRMESDGKLAGIRAEAAKARWDKENGADLHMQNDDFASTESTETHESKPPKAPRKRGATAAVWKNGFGESVQETFAYAEADNARASGARVVPIPRRAVGR